MQPPSLHGDQLVLARAEADLFAVLQAGAPVGGGGDVGEVVVMAVLRLAEHTVGDGGLGVDGVGAGLVERHGVEAREHAHVRDYRRVVLGVAVAEGADVDDQTDVEAGLAIAEMIASLSIPTVSLVLGGGHSIGVPMAVSADYSFVVPSATMVIHPVRMSGTVIGARQTYDYFQQMQDRIIGFITSHCTVTPQQVEKMMMNTQMLTKDLGTILVGKQAVDLGIIDAVGGISDAFTKLYQLIDKKK